jgi:hypothetical protein
MPLAYGFPYQPPVGSPDQSLAIPVTYFDDFVTGGFEAASANTFSAAADTADWLVTRTGASDGTITMVDGGSAGAVEVTTGTSDDDSMECQVNGEAFKIASGKSLIWEMRFKIEDVTLTDWVVGLSASDTAIIDGTPDYIGFGNTDNAASIRAINGKNEVTGVCAGSSAASTASNVTDTSSDLVADTYVVLRFEVEGTSKVRFYVDGSLKATHTTNLPDDVGLTPTFCIQAGSAAAEKLTIDYILAMQDR